MILESLPGPWEGQSSTRNCLNLYMVDSSAITTCTVDRLRVARERSRAAMDAAMLDVCKEGIMCEMLPFRRALCHLQDRRKYNANSRTSSHRQNPSYLRSSPYPYGFVNRIVLLMLYLVHMNIACPLIDSCTIFMTKREQSVRSRQTHPHLLSLLYFMPFKKFASLIFLFLFSRMLFVN